MRRAVAALSLLCLVAEPAVGEQRSLSIQVRAGGMYDYYEEFEDRAAIDVAPLLRLVVDSERYQTSIFYSPSVKIESRSGWEHAWSHRLDGNFSFDLD
ncbi:MAG: hypothetical protein VCC68_03380, partial [Myxococcota bacterium]